MEAAICRGGCISLPSRTSSSSLSDTWRSPGWRTGRRFRAAEICAWRYYVGGL